MDIVQIEITVGSAAAPAPNRRHNDAGKIEGMKGLAQPRHFARQLSINSSWRGCVVPPDVMRHAPLQQRATNRMSFCSTICLGFAAMILSCAPTSLNSGGNNPDASRSAYMLVLIDSLSNLSETNYFYSFNFETREDWDLTPQWLLAI